jgi:uncharacterized membrane protein
MGDRTVKGGKTMVFHFQRRPLISSGILLGAGLGGFADGILFHQILQLHSMLSGIRPVTDLISAKVNMAWDGYFHASVWLMTVLGLTALFRAGKRHDVPWSGPMLAGSMLGGWGLFNVVEGALDHFIFGIHHVDEYTLNHFPADFAFLLAGLFFCALGWKLVDTGSRTMSARGEERSRRFITR